MSNTTHKCDCDPPGRCETCGGTGQIKVDEHANSDDFYLMECPNCNGSGECLDCDGAGVVGEKDGAK